MTPRSLLLIALLALTTGLAGAQIVYDEGSYAFDYEQWPFGSYGGSFSAEGALLDTLVWGDTQLESVGGAMESDADTTMAWAYGAIYNTDDTVDVSLLVVRSVGELTPGYYPIDLTNYMAMFAFLDGVADFTIPEDSGDIQAWLDGIVAEHMFIGSGGGITVSAVDDGQFAGSFSGQMVDPDTFTIIAINGGSFALTGGPVLTAAPLASARIEHGAFPNPFNPKTRLRFSLPEAGSVRVSVHDLAGRRVALLEEGWAPAGERVLDWDAQGMSAGLYLYRIESAGLAVSGKVVLLP
jgi:hypothetical protein